MERRRHFLYPRKCSVGKPILYRRFRRPDGSWGLGLSTGLTTENAARAWAEAKVEAGTVAGRDRATVLPSIIGRTVSSAPAVATIPRSEQGAARCSVRLLSSRPCPSATTPRTRRSHSHGHALTIVTQAVCDKRVAFLGLLVTTLLGLVQLSYAEDRQAEFSDGFTEGYKSVMGNMVMVPMCPLAPLTPLGSTPFREGLKAGILAANRDLGRRDGELRLDRSRHRKAAERTRTVAQTDPASVGHSDGTKRQTRHSSALNGRRRMAGPGAQGLLRYRVGSACSVGC